MGYELDKLKNLYGVSSATSTYGGMSMPVKPAGLTTTAPATAPAATTTTTTTPAAGTSAPVNPALDAYNNQMARYLEDKSLYDQYEQLRKQRMLTTNMYAPAANRQILQQPIYSNANPDLVKADRPAQYTISDMPRSDEQLPSLVSKYFGTSGATVTPQGLTKAQAEAKYAADLRAQQQKYMDYYNPRGAQISWNQDNVYMPPLNTGMYQGAGGPQAYAAATGARTAFNNAIDLWRANNQLGAGNYAYVAQGGEIDTNNYATGGAVKTNYADGDAVDLGTDDEDTTDTVVAPSAYDALLARYKDIDATTLAQARADARAKQQAIIDEIAQYAAAQKAEKPDKSEMYFRLAQAFLTPGKTGSFGEGLAQAGDVMADYQKDLRTQRRADAANMLTLGLKQKELLANMSQEDLKALEAQQAKTEAARQAIELAKIKASATPASSISEYAKVAQALGLTPGTAEFQDKVQELWNEAHRPPASASGNLYSEDAVTDLAQRYIAGDSSALTGLGRSTGAMARIQNKVSELLRASGASPQDITAAQQNLKSQQKLLQNFSSSTPSSQGGQVLAMNTLVGHVNTLTKAAEALQRGDVALFNSLKTMWQEQTNQPLPNNLSLISQLVGDELQKAAVGGAGGVEERKDLKAKLYSPGANYNVIKEAADYANHLAAQRIKSLKQQWTAVKLPEERFNDYLTEDTKALLSAHTSALTTKQQQAIDWLKKNPNDPQAAAVRATLTKQGVTF